MIECDSCKVNGGNESNKKNEKSALMRACMSKQDRPHTCLDPGDASIIDCRFLLLYSTHWLATLLKRGRRLQALMIAQEPLYTSKTVLELVTTHQTCRVLFKSPMTKTVFLTFKPFDDFLPLYAVSIVLAARLGDHTWSCLFTRHCLSFWNIFSKEWVWDISGFAAFTALSCFEVFPPCV